MVRLWTADTTAESATVTLSGHRGAVTALTFDQDGTRLASGSQDTDIIVWDVVAEMGLYRLKGHKEQITCLKFLSGRRDESTATDGYILSSSKDTLLKLWDLSSQFCRETVVGHRTEVWSFDVDPEQNVIISGGAEPQLKAWKIDWSILDKPIEELDTMQVDGEDNAPALAKGITLYGNVPRSARDRVVSIKFHPSGKFVGVQSNDKTVELYQVREHDEIRKKIQRRRKRAKEKGKDIEISDDILAEDLYHSYMIVRAPTKVRSFDFPPKDDYEKKGHVQVIYEGGEGKERNSDRLKQQ